MDQAKQIIKAMLSIMESENCRFDDLTAQGVRNVAGVSQAAHAFITEEEAVVTDDEVTTDE